MAERKTCIRCTRPIATPADEAEWQAAHASAERPDGWDQEAGHLCWTGEFGTYKIACSPCGPSPRVTGGELVIHDGDYTLLSCPIEAAADALRAAGWTVEGGPQADG